MFLTCLDNCHGLFPCGSSYVLCLLYPRTQNSFREANWLNVICPVFKEMMLATPSICLSKPGLRPFLRACIDRPGSVLFRGLYELVSSHHSQFMCLSKSTCNFFYGAWGQYSFWDRICWEKQTGNSIHLENQSAVYNPKGTNIIYF